MLLLVGLTTRDVKAAGGFNVTAAVAEKEPVCAMTVTGLVTGTLPTVAKPVALMVSKDGLLDDQVTVLVRSFCD